MIYLVKRPKGGLTTDLISLPSSKSLSNRILLIRALSGAQTAIHNLSDCDDSLVMQDALTRSPEVVDIGAAGTAMRFLTAYYAVQEGQEHVLTGSERMKQRPIHPLVDALRQLGADITYEENEGFPPLRIKGKKLQGGQVDIASDISSQYISALVMLGPMLEKGLELRLCGMVSSKPYIVMTIVLMKMMGADVSYKNEHTILVAPTPYKMVDYTVEPDWSAASYWFEIMSLIQQDKSLTLQSLDDMDTCQGDSDLVPNFDDLNIIVDPTRKGLKLTCFRGGSQMDFSPRHWDFLYMPDVAQTFVVTLCLLDVPFAFTGLKSLLIKETDRIAALINELAKLGYNVHYDADGDMMYWMHTKCAKQPAPVIKTYKDHRMAMAFAPACIMLGEIRIEDPEVVSKSYPHYWDDLRAAGFVIEEVNE